LKHFIFKTSLESLWIYYIIYSLDGTCFQDCIVHSRPVIVANILYFFLVLKIKIKINTIFSLLCFSEHTA